MQQPLGVIEHYINTIETEGRGLTKWEKEFVDSIAEQIEEHGRISERQEEILERIYTERTP